MNRITQWERQIGRRMRLRELFVFFTVVECGSLTRAANQLGVSPPSISEVISEFEHAIGVKLLDRSARGVVPTIYGEVLLGRGRAAFDELRQAVRDIEFMSESAAGEVSVGCPESLAHFVVQVIEHLAVRYPRIRLNVQQVRWPTLEFPELRDRKVDLVLARMGSEKDGRLAEDLDIEKLYEDPFQFVVGRKSKWSRRRHLDLTDLIDAQWVLTPLDVLAGLILTRVFKARGLKPPIPQVATSSIHLRLSLASRGDFIAVLPRSVLALSSERYALRTLDIPMEANPSPVALVTLKERTLSRPVSAVIECVRAVAASMP